MATLRTCDEPQRTGPEIWVHRIKAGEQVHVTMFSPCLQGVWIHWAGNHSEPCYSPIEECPGHKRGLPSKQRFYLHVYNHGKQREEFLELPTGAAFEFMQVFPKGTNCRGWRMNVKRGNGQTAHLKIEVLPAVDPEIAGPLLQAKDVHKTLCKLWGLDPKSFRWNQDTDVPKPKIAS